MVSSVLLVRAPSLDQQIFYHSLSTYGFAFYAAEFDPILTAVFSKVIRFFSTRPF